MNENDIYDEMPDDPEEAFLYLENIFREICDDKINKAFENENTNKFYVQYISKVLGAIKELGIESEFAGRRLPAIADVDYEYYLNFNNDVEYYVTSLRIKRARRRRGQSVPFDQAAKSKLHKYLAGMKDVVSSLEISKEKKEVLFDRINELASEIDRDRTGLEKLGALIVASGAISGDALEKSKLINLLHAVARVIWGKQNESKQLPAPPKQIEHQPSNDLSESDDDIPF